MTTGNWNEAERLWRSSAAMDEKLALVEQALAALGRGPRSKETDFEAAEGRGAGRKQ